MSVLAALVLCASATPELALELERVDGDLVCNLHAEGVYAIDLLGALADRLERTLEGRDALEQVGTVTVDLRGRPLDQTLTYVLGACGLRGKLTSTSIEVQADYAPDAPTAELEDAAELAYLRALRHYPRSPEAARSELAIAKIKERRGNPAAARGHYDLIVQEHPDSELVPYALMRSGTLLQDQGHWSEAWAEFSNLLNLEREHPYGIPARLALARLSVELGDPQRGLYVLDALDSASPATDSADLAERLRIRALCCERLEHPMDTLRLIDQAERIEGETLESLELRAVALESSGRPGEAVRAWLALGQRATGGPLARAFTNAARLAYELGDDLGVLFVQRQAELRDAASDASAWAARSRERMGLPAPTLAGATLEGHLTHAESLWKEGLAQQALEAAKPLLAPSVLRTEEQRLRALTTYARAVDVAGRLDDGIAALRSALTTIQDPDNRGRIYALAGELYESRGRFEDAIDAYEGRL